MIFNALIGHEAQPSTSSGSPRIQSVTLHDLTVMTSPFQYTHFNYSRPCWLSSALASFIRGNLGCGASRLHLYRNPLVFFHVPSQLVPRIFVQHLCFAHYATALSTMP